MTYQADIDTSRRVIDIATGVLVGLRGCSDREAFDELVRVVHRSKTGIGTVAAELVALAGGSSASECNSASDAWGELFGGRRLLTPAS